MADVVINTTLLLKRGKAETWATKNPPLAYGEPGFERETNKLKIGNVNEDHWNDLPYLFSNPVVENNSALTITKDSNHDSIIALRGYSGAETDTVPIKTNNGLEWQSIASLIGGNATITADNVTITSTNDIIAIKGYETANENAIPIKIFNNTTQKNELDWQSADAIITTVLSNNNSNFIKTINTNIYNIISGQNGEYVGEAYLQGTDSQTGNIVLYDDNNDVINIINNKVYSNDGNIFKAINNEWVNITPVTQNEFNNLQTQLQTLINSAESGGALTIATDSILGAVKSSATINTISVNENTGVMTVNEITLDKIIQNGVKLVLDGGNAETDNELINNSISNEENNSENG